MNDRKDIMNEHSTAEESVKPGFLGGAGGGEKPAGLVTDDKKKASNNEAANELDDVENSASQGGFYKGGGGLNNARENEERAGGLYLGRGETPERGENKKQKKGKDGLLKKKGPIAAILLMLFGVGGLMSGSQAFLPFSLVEQYREGFNSMQVSASVRSDNFFRMQMGAGKYKNPIKTKLFSMDTFKISGKQRDRLAKQGITVEDDYNNTGIRVLKYDDGSGEMKIVAASEAGVKALKAEGIEADTFKNLYATDPDFFNGYNKGSMTWRGSIANWFNSVTAKFLSSNKITRNLFAGYIDKVNAANTGNAKIDAENRKAIALEMMAEKAGVIEDGGITKAEPKSQEDENGNPTEPDPSDKEKPSDVFKKADVDTDGDKALDLQVDKAKKTSISRMKSISEVEAKLDEIGKKLDSGKAGGTINKVVNFSCLAMNFLGQVGLLVAASEGLQIINLTSGYFEAVDKTKDGRGDDSPINELTEALVAKKKNTNVVLTGSGESIADNADDNIASGADGGYIKTLTTKSATTEKNAIQSSGIAGIYGDERIDLNDPSVKSFNFMGSIGGILGGIGAGMSAFKGCSYAKIAANVISAGSDAAETVACVVGVIGAFFTAGASLTACAPFLTDLGMGILMSVSISMLISAIIKTVLPMVSNMLTRDLITDIGGEDLGNALTSGANMYLGTTHRANGGSLANRQKYTEFAVAQKQVMAEYAKAERLARSPFDITSKYTFMGSILNQFMTFARADSNLMGTLSASSSVVSSSVVSLLPSAVALEVEGDFPYTDEEWERNCPYLASIGAVGDAYCNPYAVTDMSTMGNNPADVINHLNDEFLDGTEQDENVKIREDSDLANYILYCDNRNSSFGIADQNVVSRVQDFADVRTDNDEFNNVANSAIGAIPAVGDIIDVVNNSKVLTYTGYISGESCVAGNDVQNLNAPNWEKAKYYQRFIEDQSLAETMGLVDKSAVAVFLDEYYEKNPLDNSYEGILARWSGLEKEDVVAILDIIDYGVYLANYDPTTRYAFNNKLNIEEPIFFEQDSRFAGIDGVKYENIVYSDVRNRSYAV
ncbi:hypothetical protein IKD49_03255 [Candidatus Saccharibacteria bacterium]|nr:hypothetical protein [Candidatus Saccharibacteria bacterium]